MSPKKKRLALALIKDDLINTKLVLHLNEAGLNADMYMLNLSSTVFTLMGLGTGHSTEALYDTYRKRAELIRQVDISQSHVVLDRLVTDIFLFLQEEYTARNTE